MSTFLTKLTTSNLTSSLTTQTRTFATTRRMRPPPIPRVPRRPGAVALKLGMLPWWDSWGQRFPCTVLHVDNNRVLQVKSSSTVEDYPLEQRHLVEHRRLQGVEYRDADGFGGEGYNAIQVGAGGKKLKNTTIAERGHVNRTLGNVLPPDWKGNVQKGVQYKMTDYPNLYDQNSVTSIPDVIVEFRVDADVVKMVKAGQVIPAMQFVPGQMIDVRGVTKGKGFQGGMKRHHFSGLSATHGVSVSHRAIGSVGQCQDPGRVFKGKKMPGRMGGDTVTAQNLRVLKIDRGRNLIFVKGAVPGNKGNWIEIRDAVKKPFVGVGGKNYGEVREVPYPLFVGEEGVDGSGVEGIVVEWMQEADPFRAEDLL